MKLKELISFLHRALFNPTKDNWLKAIKNDFFDTWYGITYKSVNRHLKLTDATAKGHMRQQQQHYRSTISDKQSHKDSIEMTATIARINAVYISC